MIIISDQILVTLPLPEDARLSNLVIQGSTVTVETVSQYLTRVKKDFRYLGQQVDFLKPANVYAINDLLEKINAQIVTSEKYCFEEGTQDEYFLRCSFCSGGGGGEPPVVDPDGCLCLDPEGGNTLPGSTTFEGSTVFEGNSTFEGDIHFNGDEVHNGEVTFEGDVHHRHPVIFENSGTPLAWSIETDILGQLVFTNLAGCGGTIVYTVCGGIITEDFIVTTGVIIPSVLGDPELLLSDGTTIPNDFLTECCEETDPVFTAWDKRTGITITCDQIIDFENCPGSGGGGENPCDLNEQDCINIKKLGTIEDICSDILHNNLDGLQGGLAPDEFYHLTEAEHTFLEDLVENGSGVLAAHSELSDILVSHYTHDQINAHIDNLNIHFTADDVVGNEEDPIFTAERDTLLEGYITMKGETTLIDSPIFVNTEVSGLTTLNINTAALWLNDSSWNMNIGVGTGSTYTTSSETIAIGYYAGTYLSDGFSYNSFPINGLYLGNNTKPSQNNNYYETIIGHNVIGHGSNTVTIGGNTVTDTYFHGNIIATDKYKVGDSYLYENDTNDLTFFDTVVGREVTLTELLSTANYESWSLSVNEGEAEIVPSDGLVEFLGVDPIIVSREDLKVSFNLTETGIIPGYYTSPNITIDEYGRIITAEDAGGCTQEMTDLGTWSSGETVIDLAVHAGGIITLENDGGTPGEVNINFDNFVPGDTGHIEVTHTGVQTLTFSCDLADIHIANNSRQATNTVKLSSFATIDVVAYWAAEDKMHMAVIFDSKN